MRLRRDPAVRLPSVIDVHVVDDQHDVAVDGERLGALIGAVLADEDVGGPGEATLLFVDRAAITQLNALHLGGDGPTDVLSFPLDGAGAVVGVHHRLVGDVVVCPSVAAAQAPGHAGTVEDELALLVVHGALHLVGHDHAAAGDRERMWRRERELLRRHWGPLARDPWRQP